MMNNEFNPETSSLELLGCIEIAQALESYENFNLLLDLDDEDMEMVATEAKTGDDEKEVPVNRKRSMTLANAWVAKFKAWSVKRVSGEFDVNTDINIDSVASKCKALISAIQTAKSKEAAEVKMGELETYLATQSEKAAKGVHPWKRDNGSTRAFVDWLSSRCSKEKLVKADSNYEGSLNETVQAATKVMSFLDGVTRPAKSEKAFRKEYAKADVKAAKAAKKAAKIFYPAQAKAK